MNDFIYEEDRIYFIDLLAGGDAELFANNYRHLFDFREPQEKRKEFNVIRGSIYTELIKAGAECQLKIHSECSEEEIFEVDHIVPLSSAYLQRKLRNMKNNADGTKPPSLSYGSNHRDNLILACKRCNAFKKHRIMSPNGGLEIFEQV